MQGGLRRSSESRAAERSSLTSFPEAAHACVELGGNMPEHPGETHTCLKQTWETHYLGRCGYPVQGKHMQCDDVGWTAFHQVLEDIDLGTNPGEDLLEEVTPSLRLEAGTKETFPGREDREQRHGNIRLI